jgi:hypothetical protein
MLHNHYRQKHVATREFKTILSHDQFNFISNPLELPPEHCSTEVWSTETKARPTELKYRQYWMAPNNLPLTFWETKRVWKFGDGWHKNIKTLEFRLEPSPSSPTAWSMLKLLYPLWRLLSTDKATSCCFFSRHALGHLNCFNSELKPQNNLSRHLDDLHEKSVPTVQGKITQKHVEGVRTCESCVPAVQV